MAWITLVLISVLLGTLLSGTITHTSESNVNLNWRIVGGSKAPEGAFPYLVSIRKSSGKHICGGSIITPTLILTAAHCVSGLLPSELVVVVGSNNLSTGGITHSIKGTQVHQKFNPSSLKNDIAKVEVLRAINFTSVVMPIELEASPVEADVDVTASGWGLTSYPGLVPDDLQYIVLTTIGVSECQKRYPNRIDDSHLCTLTRRGEGVCHGDSGGPLVTKGRLVGIVSWGEACAIEYPDVFTRVSYFMKWIRSNSY